MRGVLVVCTSWSLACGDAGNAEGSTTDPPVPALRSDGAGRAKVAGFVHENSPENLQRLVEQANAVPAKVTADQLAAQTALVRSILPTKAAFDAVLRDDLSDRKRKKVERGLATWGKTPEANIPRLLLPENRAFRTVTVYGAKVEALTKLAAGENHGLTDDVARKHGEWAQAFSNFLRPDVTVYVVEVTGSGAGLSKRMPGWIWDGAQWRLLGPFWRETALYPFLGMEHPLTGGR